MAVIATINPEEFFRGRIEKLREALKDPSALMKTLGLQGVAESKRAFRSQGLGNIKWPARYGGRVSPFINIAGAIQDFNAGKKQPQPNRFQDRPALIDQGMRGGMLGSLTSRNRGNFVAEWGSNKQYSLTHQEGGDVFLRVNETGKQNGRAWLFKKNQMPRKGKESYAKILWPILYKGFLKQTVARRPFLGITDNLESDMIRTVETYFKKRQSA